MRLSAPVFQLKRKAKLMARRHGVTLNEALDQIAREEGFPRWSALSAALSGGTSSLPLLSELSCGDLLLLAGRPGQGKTKLGLQLLLDAARDGRQAFLFTLDFTASQAKKHLQTLDASGGSLAESVQIFTSDQISAEYIVQHMSGQRPGTIAVIDFLQLLEQQRSKPALSAQLETLSAFARGAGVILGFMSQIDRSYLASDKEFPGMEDVRLPNHADLSHFTKACFLQDGKAHFQAV